MQDNKVKALFIGSSGFTGKQVLSKATQNNFMCTCLLRNPGALGINSMFVRLEKGDVYEVADLKRVIQGQELVISTFGTKNYAEGVDDRTRAIENIITAMKEAGIKRIIHVAGFGIMKMGETLIKDSPWYPQGFQAVALDHMGAYQKLIESGLDFTVFAVPPIKEGKGVGLEKVLISDDQYPENGAMNVFVGDLAAAIVKEAKENAHIGKRVTICNIKEEEPQQQQEQK